MLHLPIEFDTKLAIIVRSIRHKQLDPIQSYPPVQCDISEPENGMHRTAELSLPHLWVRFPQRLVVPGVYGFPLAERKSFAVDPDAFIPIALGMLRCAEAHRLPVR